MSTITVNNATHNNKIISNVNIDDAKKNLTSIAEKTSNKTTSLDTFVQSTAFEEDSFNNYSNTVNNEKNENTSNLSTTEKKSKDYPAYVKNIQLTPKYDEEVKKWLTKTYYTGNASDEDLANKFEEWVQLGIDFVRKKGKTDDTDSQILESMYSVFRTRINSDAMVATYDEATAKLGKDEKLGFVYSGEFYYKSKNAVSVLDKKFEEMCKQERFSDAEKPTECSSPFFKDYNTAYSAMGCYPGDEPPPPDLYIMSKSKQVFTDDTGIPETVHMSELRLNGKAVTYDGTKKVTYNFDNDLSSYLKMFDMSADEYSKYALEYLKNFKLPSWLDWFNKDFE